MPKVIVDREELATMLRDDRVQLVEVLGPEEYEDEHLPGATNIPLRKVDVEAPRRLDRDRPVVVYCFDWP